MFEGSASMIWASMNSWFTPTVFFVVLNVTIITIALTSTLSNQKHQQAQDEQPNLIRSPSALQRLRSINFYGYRSQQEHHPPHPTTTNSKVTPDSQTHFQHHALEETNTPYIFQHPQEQIPQETTTHYVFEKTHEEKSILDRTHVENDENTPHSETQHKFELNHVETTEEEVQTLDEVYSQLTDHHVSRTKSDTKPMSGEVLSRLPAKMKKSASSKSAFGHFEEENVLECRRPATVKERGARVTEGDDEVDAKADDFINRFKQQLKLQRLDSIIRYKDMIGRGAGK